MTEEQIAVLGRLNAVLTRAARTMDERGFSALAHLRDHCINTSSIEDIQGALDKVFEPD